MKTKTAENELASSGEIVIKLRELPLGNALGREEVWRRGRQAREVAGGEATPTPVPVRWLVRPDHAPPA